MRSPFYLTSDFSLPQRNFSITSESYLLNHIEQALSHRDIRFDRMGDNMLFHRQPIVRLMNRNNILRTLEITVTTDLNYISVKLKTDFIQEVVFGILFSAMIFFAYFPLSLTIKLALLTVYLVSGLLLKKWKLWRIKKDIIHYFKQLKN